MTPDRIRAVFEKRLQLMSPALPTGWPNVGFTPPADGAAYQRCFLLPFDPQQIDVAQETTRDEGIFQVSLYYPPGVGAAVAGTRAAAVQAWFPAGLVLLDGQDRVRVHGKPAIAAAVDDPSRYIIPISVRYSTISK